MSREATIVDKARVVKMYIQGLEGAAFYIAFNALESWGITPAMIDASAAFAETPLARAIWVVKQL